MIDKQTKDVINKIGKDLSLKMPGFFGSVTLYFADNRYLRSTVEQSIKPCDLQKGAVK